MECSCLSADVDEFCEVLLDRRIKALNNHTCCECGRTIHKGETYRYEKTLFDWVETDYETCFDCNSIRVHLVCNFYYGMLLTVVADSISYGGDMPWSKISELTPRARSIVCDIIEQYWGEEEES
jgi:hypothetical protein